MCNGSIMDKLISFALPLMLSGILQLMFNAVDIVVVGRFSGSQALAAVGSTTALINVFTNLFIGISLGTNVLAARFYGAGKSKEMSETVHTSITLALITGVAMAVIGLLFSRWSLEIMGTPDDVIAQATLYMKIYFLGMPFFMLYNYGDAILRAVGDTKPVVLPDHLRCDQRHPEYDPCHRISHGSGRCRYRDGHLPADLVRPGTSVPVPVRGKLPAAILQTDHEKSLPDADLPGRRPCRYPEHSH